MITNIKILQGLVRPEQFSAIVDWNMDRNELKFDPQLEDDMLAEEFKEYWEAKTLVDKLDAVDDQLFVGVGTVAKASRDHTPPDDFTESFEAVLSDFAGRCSAEGIELAYVGELIADGLDIVIKANQQKSAEKRADGKVKKPDDFVPPEEALQKLIDDFKQREAPVAPQVQQMFGGQ